MFNSVAFHSPRWPLNYVFRSFTRPMFGMDQQARNARADAALIGAAFVEKRFPDLAVSWAASTMLFTRPGSEQQAAAINTVLENLAAAYRLDPRAAEDATLRAGLGCKNRELESVINSRFHDLLPPDERPGPWGERPQTEEQWERNWWAGASPGMRLRMLKHRLLHRPGPDDVIVPGTFDDPEP